MKLKISPFLIVPALAAGLLLGGCAEEPEPVIGTPEVGAPAEPGVGVETERPGAEAPGVGEPAGAVEEAALASRVEAALAADPDVSALAIGVDVDNGVVTLTGDVETEAQKREAEQVVRQLEGVREVVNNITVPVAE